MKNEQGAEDSIIKLFAALAAPDANEAFIALWIKLFVKVQFHSALTSMSDAAAATFADHPEARNEQADAVRFSQQMEQETAPVSATLRTVWRSMRRSGENPNETQSTDPRLPDLRYSIGMAIRSIIQLKQTIAENEAEVFRSLTDSDPYIERLVANAGEYCLDQSCCPYCGGDIGVGGDEDDDQNAD
jgi:hypothetical protein